MDYLNTPVKENFVFCKITEKLIQETAKTIKNKNSCGADLISPKLLKRVLPYISKTLCHLFNLSFKSGYIPPQMKLAKVVPIFKGKNLSRTELGIIIITGQYHYY